MYFIDNGHKENLERISKKFTQALRNREYRAVCYIAALPAIFKCFSLDKQEHSPFDWFFDYLEDPDDFIERRDQGETSGDPSGLTGQTRRLVDLALNLWNGREFDLSDGLSVWDRDLYLVALQAIDLRRSNPSINYNEL